MFHTMDCKVEILNDKYEDVEEILTNIITDIEDIEEDFDLEEIDDSSFRILELKNFDHIKLFKDLSKKYKNIKFHLKCLDINEKYWEELYLNGQYKIANLPSWEDLKWRK